MQNFDFSQLNILDVLIGIYLIYGAVGGLRRGLSGELARLLSLVVAVAAGWQFHEPLADQIELHTRLSGPAALVAGFLSTLLVAGLVMLVLRLMLKQIMEFAFKGNIERVGGLAAGMLRALCIAGLIVIGVSLAPLPSLHQQLREESRVGRTLLRWATPLYQVLSARYPDWPLPDLPDTAPTSPPASREDASPPASDRP